MSKTDFYVTVDGDDTVLHIRNDKNSMNIQLSPTEVKQLIRLLESTVMSETDPIDYSITDFMDGA